MKSIHELFIEADQELIRSTTTELGREHLCWYPSAGSDFRHIRLLEEERLIDSETYRPFRCSDCFYFEKKRYINYEASPPLVYIHTDMNLPCNTTLPHKYWKLFEPNDRIGRSMWIANITEIHPQTVIKEVSKEVYSFNANENTGRVFLIEVEMFASYDRSIRIRAPVIYFVAENLIFLVKVLLRYRFLIHTLVHIRDGGGSWGGSCRPMNFIYQVADILKLERVICDQSHEKKHFDTSKDFKVLMNELMRCECYEDENLLRFYRENLREILKHEIWAMWMSWPIAPELMPPNFFIPPDEYYYDWRRVKRPNKKTKSTMLPRIGRF